MTGLAPYSVDGDARKKALLAIAAISMLFAILLNLAFMPFLKGVAGKILGQKMTDILGATGLVSLGGIGTFACFGISWSVFDKYLWKWPFFQKIHGIPNLNGEWRGRLTSSFKDDSGVNKSYPMKLIITQTFSRMQCLSVYPSSCSYSSIAHIQGYDPVTQSCLLEYAYGNEAGKSSIIESGWEGNHLGFCHVRCTADKMNGQYFTNRTPGTKGTFSLRRKSPRPIVSRTL